MGDECGTFFSSLLCNFLICCWVTCSIRSNLLIIISYWLFHIISLFPVVKVRVETDIKESHLSETLKNDLVIAWNDEIPVLFAGFVLFWALQNFMTFQDFFHDLFKFCKTLGLAVSFKNSNTFLVLAYFLDLKQFNRHKLYHPPKMHPVWAV